MKIFNIENIPVFMQRVLSCSGDVSFEDKQGKQQDLKAMARQFETLGLRLSGAKLDELTVHFEKEDDCCRMINYLKEMALVS